MLQKKEVLRLQMPSHRANKTFFFFMCNSAKHEISLLNKSYLINILKSLLTCGDFRCFYLSNQSSKLDFPYNLTHKWDFKVTAQTQLSMDSSFLTHYQMTYFRFFQTETVCRFQNNFKFDKKRQKVIQTGRKHCGKRRNCSLRSMSPFPTVFSKGLFLRGVKGCHCVGIG